jgi:hypothetical protein
MIWPLADVNLYKFGNNKKGKFQATAPLRVAGFIERDYTEELDVSNTIPGSRFYTIGGKFYRTSVRKLATVGIEVEEKEQRKDTIIVHGSVTPAREDQQILMGLQFPDGKTRRSVQTKTKSMDTSTKPCWLSASALQCYCGIAPIHPTGNTCCVIRRLHCANFLRQSFHEWSAELERPRAGPLPSCAITSPAGNPSTPLSGCSFTNGSKWLTRVWHGGELYNEERYPQCLIRRGSPICRYLRFL